MTVSIKEVIKTVVECKNCREKFEHFFRKQAHPKIYCDSCLAQRQRERVKAKRRTSSNYK